MGSQTAGKWIIGCLIYFFIFFIVVALVTSLVSTIHGSQSGMLYNDPGIINQSNIYNNKAYCGNDGKAMNFLGNIQCNQLETDQTIPANCNAINGCVWKNYTSIFGIEITPQECSGVVNLTAENITGGSQNYCSSLGLQTFDRCKLYKCNWVYPNATGISQVRLVSKDISFSDIWGNIKDIVSFRVDFGLESYNEIIGILFSFIFFYLETIILIIAIYFSLPFIHS